MPFTARTIIDTNAVSVVSRAQEIAKARNNLRCEITMTIPVLGKRWVRQRQPATHAILKVLIFKLQYKAENINKNFKTFSLFLKDLFRSV